MLSEELLHRLLKRVIRQGRLSVTFPSGRIEDYGPKFGEDRSPAGFAMHAPRGVYWLIRATHFPTPTWKARSA